MPAPDFIAHPTGAVIAAQALDDYRFGAACPISFQAPPALPAIIGHTRTVYTAYPRGPFDLATIRDCEADGSQPYAGAA
jgi:hypothetical protein